MIVTPTNKSATELEGLHLYHADMSNCSMRVRMTLEEKNLLWTSHHLDLRKKEAVTPDYFGIHPKGLVPTLVHDGVVHIESNEIIEYLDETFPDPPLQPESPKERDEMRDWLRTATEIHIPAVKTLIYTRKIGKVLRKNEEEDAKYRSLQRDPELLAFHAAATSGIGLPKENVDKAEATLLRLFDKVETELSQHEWLVGDQFSLADISWVPLHFTLIGVDFPFDRYPHVSAWADAIRERPSFQEGHLALVPEVLTARAQQGSSMASLDGKVALVTGSSQGIGAALALALAAAGAKVVVSDLADASDTARQIKDQGGEAVATKADVTDNKSLTALVATAEKSFGPVSVLVNNAGIFGTLELKPLMQISEDEWDAVFRVNARGVFQATKAVIPSMKRGGGGSIINISSGTVLRGAPMLLHYVSSKGAVFAMTRSMATELAADDIRVNSIIAGFTASKSVINHPTMMEKIRPHTLNARMIKRDMTPDDLCGTAVFLASAASAFITGQAINVDGGAITY